MSMQTSYFFLPVAVVLFSYLLTEAVRRLAWRVNIVDWPSGPRKYHDRPVPLLGGLALYASFFLALGFLPLLTGRTLYPLLFSEAVLPKHLIGLFIAATVLVVGGVLDDKWKLRPWQQISFSVFAVAIVIASGIGIKIVTNPFFPIGLSDTVVLSLEQIDIHMFTYKGIPYFLTLWSDVFTFVWLMGMMYTTKLLDGLDGLVSGIAIIGSVVMFVASLMLGNFVVALFALILAGAYLGFLPHNFFPARIFLGESGSLLAGFLLGTLAIMGDAKVSITLLVFGVPILDVLWVIWNRVVRDKKSPFEGDRMHLHFQLLASGVSHKRTVLFLYGVSASLGVLGIVLQNVAPIIGVAIAFMVSLWILTWVVRNP